MYYQVIERFVGNCTIPPSVPGPSKQFRRQQTIQLEKMTKTSTVRILEFKDDSDGCIWSRAKSIRGAYFGLLGKGVMGRIIEISHIRGKGLEVTRSWTSGV